MLSKNNLTMQKTMNCDCEGSVPKAHAMGLETWESDRRRNAKSLLLNISSELWTGNLPFEPGTRLFKHLSVNALENRNGPGFISF